MQLAQRRCGSGFEGLLGASAGAVQLPLRT